MSIRPALLLLLGALALSIALPAAAKNRRGGDRLERLVRDLGLSADQTARVRALAKTRREATKPIKQKLRILRAQLRTLWTAPRPDRAQILAKTKAITALREQQELLRIDFKLGVHAVLSPEQRARFHKKRKPGAPSRG